MMYQIELRRFLLETIVNFEVKFYSKKGEDDKDVQKMVKNIKKYADCFNVIDR